MGMRDSQNFKSEADILERQSRPQRNSTWVPKTRDWRYATGVFQHDDFEDAPNTRSVWDIMDYDYQNSLGRIRPAVSRSQSDSGIGSDNGTAGRALIVRLRLAGKRKAQAQEMIAGPAKTPSTPGQLAHSQSFAVNPLPTPPMSSSITPATARTAETIHSPHVLDSIGSLYTFPLFQRSWVDETYTFNAKHVRSTLRAPNAKDVEDLGANYGWYYDAPQVDAIFPPGVPLSAKEICAFYPHHVRWKGVMIRLTNNDYRGADIMGMQAHFRGAPDHYTPAVYMNNYQCDIAKTAIPGFRTATHKGKSDFNLRTDHFAPGPHVQSMRKGFSLPTFEDLLRGLRHLPAGLDARDLTHCLSWYLSICESFTPKLDLNVLHTQSLVRALRQPLKPFGPQNLDRKALQEWRTNGCFEELPVEYKKPEAQYTRTANSSLRRTQLRLDLEGDGVQMDLKLPIRHVLTFPFLSLHGVVSEAFKMGIEKAEIRQASRKIGNAKRDLEIKRAAYPTASDDVEKAVVDEKVDKPAESVVEEPKKPYRIPKRPRPEDADTDMQTRISPTGPCMLAPALHRSFSPCPPRSGPLSRSSNMPAPPSTYTPPQYNDGGSVYGRRDLFSGRPDPSRGVRPSGPLRPRTSPCQRVYGEDRDGYHAYGRRR